MNNEEITVENINESMELEIEENDEGSDEMQEPFDPSEINIQTKQDAMSNIISRLEHDEIDLNTDFQRHADLWTPAKMSRLIESILVRLPLPAFYFDASDDDRWLVVDGLQRLSSIKKFVIDQRLRLSGLEYLTELKGSNYQELSAQQMRRINECPVTLFLIQPGTPEEVKYSVFRRINTGGLVLNNQEIRNALAKPRQRDYLAKLAEDENMKMTMGDQSKRMLDQELVLRFIAFFRLDFEKSRKNIAVFMDDAMKYLEEASDGELGEIECAFRNSTRICAELFGERAFEKRSANSADRRRRKNASLFESWTVRLARTPDLDRIESKLMRNKDLLRDKLNKLLDDENGSFFRAISMATQKTDNVKIRHSDIDRIIREIIEEGL